MPPLQWGTFIDVYEEIHMKRFLGYAAMLALLSAPAFAAKNSETINLPEAVTVGTTQLPAADYRVTWTGTGPSVQVTLAHGNSTITVPAKLVEQKNNPSSILTESKDGSKVLEAINLNKVSLVFSASPTPGQ
jgi:hypothetical protein